MEGIIDEITARLGDKPEFEGLNVKLADLAAEVRDTALPEDSRTVGETENLILKMKEQVSVDIMLYARADEAVNYFEKVMREAGEQFYNAKLDLTEEQAFKLAEELHMDLVDFVEYMTHIKELIEQSGDIKFVRDESGIFQKNLQISVTADAGFIKLYSGIIKSFEEYAGQKSAEEGLEKIRPPAAELESLLPHLKFLYDRAPSIAEAMMHILSDSEYLPQFHEILTGENSETSVTELKKFIELAAFNQDWIKTIEDEDIAESLEKMLAVRTKTFLMNIETSLGNEEELGKLDMSAIYKDEEALEKIKSTRPRIEMIEELAGAEGSDVQSVMDVLRPVLQNTLDQLTKVVHQAEVKINDYILEHSKPDPDQVLERREVLEEYFDRKHEIHEKMAAAPGSREYILREQMKEGCGRVITVDQPFARLVTDGKVTVLLTRFPDYQRPTGEEYRGPVFIRGKSFGPDSLQKQYADQFQERFGLDGADLQQDGIIGEAEVIETFKIAKREDWEALSEGKYQHLRSLEPWHEAVGPLYAVVLANGSKRPAVNIPYATENFSYIDLNWKGFEEPLLVGAQEELTPFTKKRTREEIAEGVEANPSEKYQLFKKAREKALFELLRNMGGRGKNMARVFSAIGGEEIFRLAYKGIEVIMQKVGMQEPFEDLMVMLSTDGSMVIKPAKEYRTQGSGTKGDFQIEGESSILMRTSLFDTVVCFTDKGRAYPLDMTALVRDFEKERKIGEIIPMQEGEKIVSMLPINNFESGYVVMVTKYGKIVRMRMDEFNDMKVTGKIAMVLGEGEEGNDSVLSVSVTDGSSDILVASKKGQIIRFKEDEIGETGAHVKGRKKNTPLSLRQVTPEDLMILAKMHKDGEMDKNQLIEGIKILFRKNKVRMTGIPFDSLAEILITHAGERDELESKIAEFMENYVRNMDSIVSLEVVDSVADETEVLLTVTEKGYVQKVGLDAYPAQGFGGQGVINMNLRKTQAGRTGEVVDILRVRADDDVFVLTRKGKVLRVKVSDLGETLKDRRATVGVRLIKVDADDSVVGISKIESATASGVDFESMQQTRDQLSEQRQASAKGMADIIRERIETARSIKVPSEENEKVWNKMLRELGMALLKNSDLNHDLRQELNAWMFGQKTPPEWMKEVLEAEKRHRMEIIVFKMKDLWKKYKSDKDMNSLMEGINTVFYQTLGARPGEQQLQGFSALIASFDDETTFEARLRATMNLQKDDEAEAEYEELTVPLNENPLNLPVVVFDSDHEMPGAILSGRIPVIARHQSTNYRGMVLLVEKPMNQGIPREMQQIHGKVLGYATIVDSIEVNADLWWAFKDMHGRQSYAANWPNHFWVLSDPVMFEEESEMFIPCRMKKGVYQVTPFDLADDYEDEIIGKSEEAERRPKYSGEFGNLVQAKMELEAVYKKMGKKGNNLLDFFYANLAFLLRFAPEYREKLESMDQDMAKTIVELLTFLQNEIVSRDAEIEGDSDILSNIINCDYARLRFKKIKDFMYDPETGQIIPENEAMIRMLLDTDHIENFGLETESQTHNLQELFRIMREGIFGQVKAGEYLEHIQETLPEVLQQPMVTPQQISEEDLEKTRRQIEQMPEFAFDTPKISGEQQAPQIQKDLEAMISELLPDVDGQKIELYDVREFIYAIQTLVWIDLKTKYFSIEEDDLWAILTKTLNRMNMESMSRVDTAEIEREPLNDVLVLANFLGSFESFIKKRA
ncbi:MAG TPA: DNA gyrase C-terminal beta-propeller domain-containing protein, partial [bacterium]|nr:DNA gyrase C-terminal beta-propeller domain-containing protein [bacterium]